MLAAALFLTAKNFREERTAAVSSEKILQKLIETGKNMPENSLQEEKEEIAMSTVEIDGSVYIGILEIPSLSLVLPVAGEYTEATLKKTPCRYQGSAEGNDLIIAAHNYKGHFGGLHLLEAGDDVSFTAANGTVFSYAVCGKEKLDETAVEEMEAGTWDLTLFTCTLDSKSRITVRCTAAKQTENN